MFSFKKTLSVSLLLSTLSLSAFAQNDIALGIPAYGGNGCPNLGYFLVLMPWTPLKSVGGVAFHTLEPQTLGAMILCRSYRDAFFARTMSVVSGYFPSTNPKARCVRR